jgi:hypothetical protein
MPNPKDTGNNVKVDFVWGNMPMQPNDDRGENTLDYDLDNHVIVEEGRYGFPAYTPGNVGDGDDVANTTVPAITGVLEATALTRLTNAGLDGVALATTTEGATEGNDGKVASQDPAAGTAANVGDEVEYSLFEFEPVEPLTFTSTNDDWNQARVQGAMGTPPGKININLGATGLREAILAQPTWNILASTTSATLTATYSVAVTTTDESSDYILLTPVAETMSAEFLSTFTGDRWDLTTIVVNSAPGTISITGYYM